MLTTYQNMITQYSISQEKKWSWKTALVYFPPRKENMPIRLHQNIHNIYFTSDKLSIVRGAMERDPIHSTMYRLTLNGWPERIQEICHLACHLWGTRDKLTIQSRVLLKGDRVCIPPELYERRDTCPKPLSTGLE